MELPFGGIFFLVITGYLVYFIIKALIKKDKTPEDKSYIRPVLPIVAVSWGFEAILSKVRGELGFSYLNVFLLFVCMYVLFNIIDNYLSKTSSNRGGDTFFKSLFISVLAILIAFAYLSG